MILQGRVKFPTGGKAHEPKGRFGEIPKPTVKHDSLDERRMFFVCYASLKKGGFFVYK
jgi:hypothetical protein